MSFGVTQSLGIRGLSKTEEPYKVRTFRCIAVSDLVVLDYFNDEISSNYDVLSPIVCCKQER